MKISLSAKITLIIVTSFAIAGGITGYLVYKDSTQALQRSISDNQLTLAKQTVDKIDRFLHERQADIQSFASRQQVRDLLTDPKSRTPVATAQLRQNINYIKDSSGTWSEIAIFDAAGKGLSSTTEAERGLDETTMPLFQKAAAGQANYSDVFISKDTNQPTMVFMAPVRTNITSGPVVGVIEGELAWPPILEIMGSLGDTPADLLNSKGVSIGGNEANIKKEILTADFSKSPVFIASQASSPGSKVLPGIDKPDESFVTSYVKEKGFNGYKGNGWTLILGTPRKVAFAPADRLARQLLIIGLLVLLTSTGIFWLVIYRLILRPIVDLRGVVSRLSRGDFSLRTSINSTDELGELGRGFNDMADKMQFAYGSLKAATEGAENERRTLQTLLDRLPVGVFVAKAPSGEPIMINNVGVKLLGRGLVPGARRETYTEVYDTIKPDGSPYPADELPLSITLRENKSVIKDDVAVRKPDGTIVELRVACAPIQSADGSVRTAVAVFEDISRERELERSRDEFFSIASHELRTPLTAIRGNTSLIQQYYGDKLPDEDVKEMVNDIHESSIRLIEIVNDFLDTSRLEQKRMKFEFESFDPIELAESAIKEYQVTSSRRKIAVEVRKPALSLPSVYADRNRTKQVLINLVGNALKFTQQGSITISFEPQVGGVKLLVTDTGQGMPPEAQKLLFKKFEQTGSTVLTRDSVRGTGLGLYISKLIMEQMGGRIQLESSTPGEGTTFSFILPIAGTRRAPSTVNEYSPGVDQSRSATPKR